MRAARLRPRSATCRRGARCGRRPWSSDLRRSRLREPRLPARRPDQTRQAAAVRIPSYRPASARVHHAPRVHAPRRRAQSPRARVRRHSRRAFRLPTPALTANTALPVRAADRPADTAGPRRPPAPLQAQPHLSLARSKATIEPSGRGPRTWDVRTPIRHPGRRLSGQLSPTQRPARTPGLRRLGTSAVAWAPASRGHHRRPLARVGSTPWPSNLGSHRMTPGPAPVSLPPGGDRTDRTDSSSYSSLTAIGPVLQLSVAPPPGEPPSSSTSYASSASLASAERPVQPQHRRSPSAGRAVCRGTVQASAPSTRKRHSRSAVRHAESGVSGPPACVFVLATALCRVGCRGARRLRGMLCGNRWMWTSGGTNPRVEARLGTNPGGSHSCRCWHPVSTAGPASDSLLEPEELRRRSRCTPP